MPNLGWLHWRFRGASSYSEPVDSVLKPAVVQFVAWLIRPHWHFAVFGHLDIAGEGGAVALAAN